MKKLIYLFSVLTLAASSCADHLSGELDYPGLGTKSSSEITAAINGFSFELLQELYRSGDNTVVSPMSLSTALSMAAAGAKGETFSEIMDVLGFSLMGIEDVGEYNRQLSLHLKNADSEVSFSSANSMWLNNGFEPKREYQDYALDYYNALVRSIDFQDTQNTLSEINEWCSANTDGMIPSFLNELNPGAVLILLNAILLNGKWPPLVYTAGPMSFTDGAGKTSVVPAVKGYVSAQYYEDKYIKMVRLPISHGAFCLTLLVPNKGLDCSIVLSDLNEKRWLNYLSKMKEETGVVMFPKMEITFDQSMINPLKAMGIKSAFGSSADFSGISRGIFISEVKQQTRFSVDEAGVKAAAVSMVEFSYGSSGERPDTPRKELLIADHPFIFAIEETKSGAILFIGNKSAI